MEIDPFIFRLSIFILSIFIGYYVVWSVTPSLHTPLMSVTNAISSVIIVGAIIASLAGSSENVFSTSSIFGFIAIVLAAINIFGGFLVTQRMLQMYKKKKDKKKQAEMIRNALKKNDVVICTALIPGKPAPRILTEDLVKLMKPGSIVYDLAAE